MNLEILSLLVYSFKINMNIEILKTTRGKEKLCMDGYMYNRQYTLKNGREYWLCKRRSTKCKGTAIISFMHMFVFVKNCQC